MEDYGIPDSGTLDFDLGQSEQLLLPRAIQIDPGLMQAPQITSGQLISRGLNDVSGFLGNIFGILAAKYVRNSRAVRLS